VYTRPTAFSRALAASGAGPGDGMGQAAAAAFDVTLRRLGEPTGPAPEPWSWRQMVVDDLPDPLELELTRVQDLQRRHPSGLPHLSPDR
jgi:uncharacterized Ntn-hydrolase superfamily protein